MKWIDLMDDMLTLITSQFMDDEGIFSLSKNTLIVTVISIRRVTECIPE